MHVLTFAVHKENWEDYCLLLSGLKEQYQPHGWAEELEVERIAVIWWRLKRAWTYENAANHVAIDHSSCKKAVPETETTWGKMGDTDGPAIEKLRNLKIKGEFTEERLSDFKRQLFAESPFIKKSWPLWEEAAAETYSEQSSYQEGTTVPLSLIIEAGLRSLQVFRELRNDYLPRVAIEQNVIPNQEALDRILRYEAASDRSLSKAVDRLDRLQKSRKGE